jgi:hypothetical protein
LKEKNMTMSRLEEIVHVVIAKPIAWTIYGIWHGMKWVGRGAVSIFTRARHRWTEHRQSSQASGSSAA